MANENYLIHYGVKGMKWGVIRRKTPEEKRARREKRQADYDKWKKGAQESTTSAISSGVRNLRETSKNSRAQRIRSREKYIENNQNLTPEQRRNQLANADRVQDNIDLGINIINGSVGVVAGSTAALTSYMVAKKTFNAPVISVGAAAIGGVLAGVGAMSVSALATEQYRY